MRSALHALVAVATAGATLIGQQAPAPAFEVATVKRMQPGDSRQPGIQPLQPGGLWRAVGLTLREFVRLAYGNPVALLKSQIVGGPAWVDADRFEIVAKVPDAVLLDDPSHPVSMMLRGLLEERFKLALHRETRQLPVFEMVLAAGTPQMNPRFRRTTTECVSFMARSASVAGPGCGFRRFDGGLAGSGITMAVLAGVLSQQPEIDRVVIDRTSLAGEFDLNLEYQPFATATDTSGAAGPSLFTALQEQLGLKLQSTRGPVEVRVIDHAEQPVTN